jgi:hypothetical protein
MFILQIEHVTGYIQVLTFPSRFERALHMVGLASEPVVLRIMDCV